MAKVFGVSIKELTDNTHGMLGKHEVLFRIGGLSLNSIYKLLDYIDYLKYKECGKYE